MRGRIFLFGDDTKFATADPVACGGLLLLRPDDCFQSFITPRRRSPSFSPWGVQSPHKTFNRDLGSRTVWGFAGWSSGWVPSSNCVLERCRDAASPVRRRAPTLFTARLKILFRPSVSLFLANAWAILLCPVAGGKCGAALAKAICLFRDH